MSLLEADESETVVATCPVCLREFESLRSGQPCPECRDRVLALDHYGKSDLRFVGVLSGVLTAAISSMPGAFLGYVIGRQLEQPTRGCTIGVIAFAVAGFVAGFRLGKVFVTKMEQKHREQVLGK